MGSKNRKPLAKLKKKAPRIGAFHEQCLINLENRKCKLLQNTETYLKLNNKINI